jgi:hypothetical protein
MLYQFRRADGKTRSPFKRRDHWPARGDDPARRLISFNLTPARVLGPLRSAAPATPIAWTRRDPRATGHSLTVRAAIPRPGAADHRIDPRHLLGGIRSHIEGDPSWSRLSRNDRLCRRGNGQPLNYRLIVFNAVTGIAAVID